MASISNSTFGFVAGPSSTVNTGDIHVNSSHSQLAVPRPSRHFHGRGNDMARLHLLFFQKGKRKVVISGLAGYGKTELAKQFADGFTRRLGHPVFWVPAENDENLKTTYNSILKESFETNCTSLYVYDNAVTRRDICEYLPPDTNNALVLITSQVHDWGGDIITLDLKPVRVRASLDIFREILEDRYERVKNEITSIVKFTDGIPLALVLIAGLLRRTMDVLGSDFDIFKFKKDILSPSTLNKKIDRAVDSPYRHSIRAAIHVTLNNMSTWLDPEENNITHLVLCVCAHLEPDRIKIKEVEEILNVCGISDNELIRRCVDTVTDFSFIQSENDYFVIHRLCQEFLINYYEDEKKNTKEACYRACFLWAIEKDLTIHTIAILRQADNNKAVVNEILRKYCLCGEGDNVVLQPSQPNYLKLKTLLENLVVYGCHDCISLFLNGINISSRQHIVNELELVRRARAFIVRRKRAEEMVRLLVDMSGRNVDARYSGGGTMLHWAARLGNEAAVSGLLVVGSDVQARDNDGRTALHWAATTGKEAVVSTFLEVGSDVLASDRNGQTALHLAAERGWEAMVPTLLAAGSDVLARDNYGQTALHKAARCKPVFWLGRSIDYVAVVHMLLRGGADVNARDDEGRTALDIAATTEGLDVDENVRRHVQQILRAHGTIT